MNLSGPAKIGAIVATLFIALDLQARWTHQSFSLDLTGNGPVGAPSKASPASTLPNAAPVPHVA